MVTINDGDVITTSAQLDAAPVGTTFIDCTDDLLVKTGTGDYAMAADLGNGEPWAYLDHAEVIGAVHSPHSIYADAEAHVPFSTFLPMRVHQTPR